MARRFNDKFAGDVVKIYGDPPVSKHRASRKTRMYGHGAYEHVLRDKIPASVEHARNDFLQTVAELAPEVLSDLGKEPFRLYRKTPAICFEADKERIKKHKQHNLYDRVREKAKWEQQRPKWKEVETPPHSEKVDLVERHIWTTYERPPLEYVETQWHDPLGVRPPFPIDTDGSIAAFKASLLEWSRRHNLNDLWCRERAYATLDLWCYSPASRKARIWHHEFGWQPVMAFRGGERQRFDFVFRHETHYPRDGFRQQVKQRILTLCEEQLDAFLDERERQAIEGGMVATPQKHAKEHFEWLTRRQIQGMTCRAIFDLYKEQSKSQAMPRLITTKRAVEKAVSELAELIQLTPRYAGRGRKPKATVTRR
ncbi:MAG TPA: hypothetical protein VEX70_13350 [Pyrinomonadaceae bacterium]|nr:hypothetical protein [Pyrinomonadaceae bacterium]